MTTGRELCLDCGENTAVGTPLFSDRLTRTGEGATEYLCRLCAERRRPSREVHSDEERERERALLEQSAFAFGSFAKGGH